MSLVERCKTKYQKRKVLYNLAGVMALTFAVATITHGVVKRNCVPRLLDVVDRLETGDIFETQGSAAEYYGIPPRILSNHLNRGVELHEGLHFERVGVFK